MAKILPITFSNVFSSMKMFELRFKISLMFAPEGPIDNKTALVQIMAWCWIGDKPLPEPQVTQFNDAYMHHSTAVS